MNPWIAFIIGLVLGVLITFGASLMYAASRGREYDER
jgi:gas vesicle protein